MRLVFPELPPSVHSLGVAVLRTQSVAVLFSSVNLILLALNQLAGRFVRCELSVLTSTIVAAAFVVPAVGHFGVLAASLGQVVKALTGTLLLTIPLRRKLSMGPVPWKEIGHVLRPLLSAGMFTKLAPIIDRSIGSAAASGSMSLLAFGQSIYSASTGIAERSIVAPRLPALKRGASSDSPLRVALLLGAAGIVLVIALVSASLVAQHVPKLVELVGDRQLALLTALLVGLAGFPVAALTVQWAAAAVVVLGRPDLSAKIVGAGFLVGVAFKYVGFLMGGIHGLAVGISMYYLLNALAFLLVLRRIIRRPGTPDGAPPASPGP